MATITNAFTTGSAKGIREDLTDQIHRVAVEDTPFMSMVGTSKCKNTLHEWQIEDLEAPDTANARPEGNETARAAANPTVRLSNVCQISDENATVSGTLEAVDKAGRDEEMAHQMALKTIKLRKSMEAIMLGNQAFTGSGTRTLRGFEAWIRSNTSRGAAGADPADPNVTPGTTATDGTQRAFTETLLKDQLQECYTAGGKVSVALMGPHAKKTASAFTGRSNAVQAFDKAGIQQAANMYYSDFGDIKLVPHRYLRSAGRTCILLDPEKVKVGYLRKFADKRLGVIGDAETNLIISEYTLEMCNEKAHGVIADLLTA